ncbi:MAG: SpoIIE family protein phosphatase [Acidobacteriota bacterium]
MAYLVITGSDGQRTTHHVETGARVSIGRSSKNEVVLADLSLSREHAELTPEADGWRLRDCGSRNGTYLNGRRVVDPTVLETGDTISLGSCNLEFQHGDNSEERVTFSNQPLASEGTVILPVNEVMTTPNALPALRARGSQRGDLEAQLRRFEVVEKANMELLGHEPVDVMLPKIMDLVSRAVAADRVAVFLQERGELRCRASRLTDGDGDLAISRTIAATVMDEHASVLTSDAQTDARFKEGASILSQGIHSVMAAPLWNNKDVIGLIYADSRVASGLFDDEDLRMLTMLANIAAIQIENARLFEDQLEKQRFEQEAQAAADIQRNLLPSEPMDVAGYRLAGFNTPCYEVGGDYFDYVRLGEQRLGVVLADVAGKGMPAAMLMATIQATFRAHAELARDPLDIVRHLEQTVTRSAPANRFVTLFFINLDFAQHKVKYVNAGHAPSPVLIRTAGDIEVLPPSGPPLGVLAGTTYVVTEVEMQPGDFIFICSDGVTDTVDPEDNEYSEERLASFLASQAGRPADDIQKAVEDQLADHASGTAQPDDLTMVILGRLADTDS